MLQHILQQWIDTDNFGTRHKGVCAWVYSRLHYATTNSWEYTDDIFNAAVNAFVGGEDSGCTAFPVRHPTGTAENAYWSAQREGTMRTGQYGANRLEFVEFVRDYAEEAWK